MKKQQVVIIHGGDPYDTYEEFLADLKRSKLDMDDVKGSTEKRWKDTIQDRLGSGYEVLRPEMPNWMNAKYIEWEIYFRKLLKLVKPDAIFIGHSLGGIFLARFFSENPNHEAAKLILLAPPYATAAGFSIPDDTAPLAKFGSRLHLYFSEDDPIIPFSNLKKYKKIVPEARVSVFMDRGHFYAQKEFPEIVEDIRES